MMLEALLDLLWQRIFEGILAIRTGLYLAFSPLNRLGPAFAISFLAASVVGITKVLGPKIRTRRYLELQREFLHWKEVRAEASRLSDKEKADALSRLIDRSELNKIYYDYIMEGFLLSLINRVLPLLCALIYVNEAYRPERIVELFGMDYVIRINICLKGSVTFGAASWFVISALLSHAFFSFTGGFIKKPTIFCRLTQLVKTHNLRKIKHLPFFIKP